VRRKAFSLKAVQEKTESFENVSLKQPFASAHRRWKKITRSEIGGTPVGVSDADVEKV
jgi:hypothetical protein